MVKRLTIIFLAVLLLAGIPAAHACVGKILTLGVVGAPEELLFAEMISVLVNERTGTMVKTVTFKDTAALYAAVKKGEVGLVVENTDRGMKVLARPSEKGARAAYDLLKKEYRAGLNMVWLEPMAQLAGGGEELYVAPVITVDTMTNLPALPKLLNKLSGAVNDDAYGKLMKAVKGDAKPKKVARDFLKSKKLI